VRPNPGRAHAGRPRHRQREHTMSRTITISDVAWTVIAIFVVLAYFNGWG
jgi:hypothetical protein